MAKQYIHQLNESRFRSIIKHKDFYLFRDMKRPDWCQLETANKASYNGSIGIGVCNKLLGIQKRDRVTSEDDCKCCPYFREL